MADDLKGADRLRADAAAARDRRAALMSADLPTKGDPPSGAAPRPPQDPANPPGITDIEPPVREDGDEGGDPPAPPAPPAAPDPEDVKLKARRVAEGVRQAILKNMPKAPSVSVSVTADIRAKAKALRDAGKDDEADDLVFNARQNAAQGQQQITEDQRRIWEENARVRAEATERVLESHPELIEFEEAVARGEKPEIKTDFHKEMARVYTKYPDLETSPDGPLKAMEIAEKELEIRRLRAAQPPAGTPPAGSPPAPSGRPDPASTVVAGALGSSVRSPSGAAPGRRVALTAGQIEIADRLGVTHESYASRVGRTKVLPAKMYTDSRRLPKRLS